MKKLACLILVAMFTVAATPSINARAMDSGIFSKNITTIVVDSSYYWSVYELLKTNYVKPDSTPNDSAVAIWQRVGREIKASPASQESLIYDGLEKVAQLFDRYTCFFTPKEAKEFHRATKEETNFYGVGAIMGYGKKDKFTPRFIELFDGPAKNAGINVGDYLLRVNGRDCRKLTIKPLNGRSSRAERATLAISS